MAYSDLSNIEYIHPIDIAEHIIEQRGWEFDRIHDDQIALAVEGQWKTYSITLAWSALDDTLRLICTYETKLPPERTIEFFQLLNSINDRCWAGAFTWWEETQLLTFRYGLITTGQEYIQPDQVDTMISTAVAACERYYPAVQLVIWGDRSANQAIQYALGDAIGRA